MTTDQATDEIVEGTHGQAPIKASKLRQMLFDAKSEVVILAEKLFRSERDRADQANKMAAHKDTRERAAALDDLVFNRGEGVLLHIRRPDETAIYPIIIHKAALAATHPPNWITDVVDPIARTVLAQGEKAEAGWVTSDPNRDAAIREDHEAIREVLNGHEGDLADLVALLTLEHKELTAKLRGAQTSAGKYRDSCEKHESRIAALVDEVGQLRAAVSSGKDVDVDVEAAVLEGMSLSPEEVQVAANVAEAVAPADAAKAIQAEITRKEKEERMARTKSRRAKRAAEAKKARDEKAKEA